MPKTNQEIIDHVDRMHPNDIAIAKDVWNGVSDIDSRKVENIILISSLLKKLTFELTRLEDNLNHIGGVPNEPEEDGLWFDEVTGDLYLKDKDPLTLQEGEKMMTLLIPAGETTGSIIISTTDKLQEITDKIVSLADETVSDGDLSRIREEILSRP